MAWLCPLPMSTANFHQRFAHADWQESLRELISHHVTEIGRARVAAREKDFARRRSQPGDKFGEITIFRHQDVRPVAGGAEDFTVRGACEADIARLHAGLAEFRCNPTRQRRRQMMVEPDGHSRG